MAKKFFTNREGNTLMKQFEGLLANNPNIKNLDSVVGFLRASGYFTLHHNSSKHFLRGENSLENQLL